MRILLVSYDNGMYIHHFPLGLAYVATKMRQQGHEVSVYSQDVYHYPEEHLADYLARNKFDVVGLGMCAGYYQYAKFKKIRKVIPANVEVWLGGHMVSPCPDYFRDQFGVKPFVGEYDYEKEIDSIGEPAWDLFPVDYYTLLRLPHSDNRDRCFGVLSGRGCPFRCNFCYRLEEGHRARGIERIIGEISRLQKEYNINYIDFCDELLMIKSTRTIDLSIALRPLGIKWCCNGRLNYALPTVLKLMKQAGCVFINYGIESVDDTVLRNMDKNLTVKQIIEGIENTLAEGLSPGLNIIWGNIGDTKETLWKSVDFLLKYDDQVQMRTIRPVTPYPGSPLYDYAVKQGMVKDVKDFYECKHTNSDLLTCNFTNLTDAEYYDQLRKANLVLAGNYFKKQQEKIGKQIDDLYQNRDVSFRGFRQT